MSVVLASLSDEHLFEHIECARFIKPRAFSSSRHRELAANAASRATKKDLLGTCSIRHHALVDPLQPVHTARTGRLQSEREGSMHCILPLVSADVVNHQLPRPAAVTSSTDDLAGAIAYRTGMCSAVK